MKNTRNTICPTFLFACETKHREIFFQCQFGDKDNTARARWVGEFFFFCVSVKTRSKRKKRKKKIIFEEPIKRPFSLERSLSWFPFLLSTLSRLSTSAMPAARRLRASGSSSSTLSSAAARKRKHGSFSGVAALSSLMAVMTLLLLLFASPSPALASGERRSLLQKMVSLSSL